MNKSEIANIFHFQEELQKGDILHAYRTLTQFMTDLRTTLVQELSEEYSFATLQRGFLDLTYFYFTNDELKRRKLKLSVVLNQIDMRFELWLLGNTKAVQKEYWEKLRQVNCFESRQEMHQYYIGSAILDATPEFANRDRLITNLKESIETSSSVILDTIQSI